MSTLDGSEGGVGNPRYDGRLDLRHVGFDTRFSERLAELLSVSEVPAELARLPRHAFDLMPKKRRQKISSELD